MAFAKGHCHPRSTRLMIGAFAASSAMARPTGVEPVNHPRNRITDERAADFAARADYDTLFANNNPHNIGALQKVIDPI
jgi:hypothetical protein